MLSKFLCLGGEHLLHHTTSMSMLVVWGRVPYTCSVLENFFQHLDTDKKFFTAIGEKICSAIVFSKLTDIPSPQRLPTFTGGEKKKVQPAQYIATAKKTPTAVEEIPGKCGKVLFPCMPALILCRAALYLTHNPDLMALDQRQRFSSEHKLLATRLHLHRVPLPWNFELSFDGFKKIRSGW